MASSMDPSRKASFEAGYKLAHPPPGEEIVISGMSGRFPSSRNVYEFREGLMNKVDLITEDPRLISSGYPEVPTRCGQLKDLNKFDAGFFGVHHNQADTLDPMGRKVLESAIEAIFDAGVNPLELRGTRTGVATGMCQSESETVVFEKRGPYSFTGVQMAMYGQRLAYYLGINGPVMKMDSACSSSLAALENAYDLIRSGKVDNFIVCGCQLMMNAIVTRFFAYLGVLSKEGKCSTFDEAANGYVRSEGVGVVFIQKAKNAKRIYATVLHAKCNNDGYKDMGITFPSYVGQKMILEEVYEECGIEPKNVQYLEAHGTGTLVGDPEEIKAVDAVFSVGRTEPLLIGSIKSCIGHTEGAAGICALIKVLIGMDSGYIPPNLNFNRPKESLKGIVEGRIKVVSEKMPWPEGAGLAGINSFGFGGTNCHVILQRNKRIKEPNTITDNLPRLICVSGRTEEAITTILDDVKNRPLDPEFIGLIHEAFKFGIEEHLHRGFSIMSKTGELNRSMDRFECNKGPLYFVCSGIDNNWLTIGSQLLVVAQFEETLKSTQNILTPMKVNIYDMIKQNRPDNTKDMTTHVLGSIAVQIALVDLLKTLGIVPDYIIGYSFGELISAYIDGCLDLQQTLSLAYCMAVCLNKIEKNSKGSGDVITITKQIINETSSKLVTYIQSLSGNGVSAFNKDSIKLNSKTVETELLQAFKKIIQKPKNRSHKWISMNAAQGKNASSKQASAEFFVTDKFSPLPFTQFAEIARENAVVMQFGSGWPQDILQNNLHENIISFGLKDSSDNYFVHTLLTNIGKIYEKGHNPRAEYLYPKIQWPVSRSTPMISPLIKWNYDHDWFLMGLSSYQRFGKHEQTHRFSLAENDEQFLVGHVIDDRVLFPATGYLYTVWKAFCTLMREDLISVVFEDIKFMRATNMPKAEQVSFTVTLQRHNNGFEVFESGQLIVSGKISKLDETAEEVDESFLTSSVENKPESYPVTAKDIYKSLRLRGYNYSGVFRSIKCSNMDRTKFLVEWRDNWIGFLDNILQTTILGDDTRALYIPIGIKKITLDAKLFLKHIESMGENPLVAVKGFPDCGIVKTVGIQFEGMDASSITRRKPISEPVLESYVFVPNEAQLSTKESVRVNTQIAIENNYGIKLAIVELIDDATQEGAEPLGPLIHDSLSDQPLIQPEIKVLTNKSMEIDNVTIENKQLTTVTNSFMVVASNMISRKGVLTTALAALKENGYLISREDLQFDANKADVPAVDILTVHTTPTEKLLFMRKKITQTAPLVINISDRAENFDWMPDVQKAVENDAHLILCAQNEPTNGLLGLTNCLRREAGGKNVRCVHIFDIAPKFNLSTQFYAKQLQKGLAINVLKNGKWGTYRHLLFKQQRVVPCEHSFVNVGTKGDMSSLKWYEGNLTVNSKLDIGRGLVQIYYSALNFKDIMLVAGKIDASVFRKYRPEDGCYVGMEFAGRDKDGRRVFGLEVTGALSTVVSAYKHYIWPVPDEWTMEEACTVPVVYMTALYAMVEMGGVKPGQSILIHAGTGGVGQAAINLALYYGMTIFITVGTQEKRDFIRKIFPQIIARRIGNSRDTSFEDMVIRETKGRGVDFVLNSLADEKLQASLRCLAPGGHFLEIGKVDLVRNSPLPLSMFAKGCSFHGIMLDAFLVETDARVHAKFAKMVLDAIEAGAVKPLPRFTFKTEDVVKAFRYMAAGKHMGKVLLKIRPEEKPERVLIPPPFKLDGIPRYTCKASASYIITGGLGGFGLELADWLFMRGARNIVLASRSGIRNGYQSIRTRLWSNHDAIIKISKDDITTEDGCLRLIQTANELAPVDGIFHLAVVLNDAVFENQTPETFNNAFCPKATAAEHLDVLSRELCPELRAFVVFSSVVCGRGNTGQANYGMANSVMERICEIRKQDGLPALAIQWGAVGDVGLVADMQEDFKLLDIGGTLQQSITSCLGVMDTFLTQDEPIVSSIVVAEKRRLNIKNIAEAVANILGIRDMKTVSSNTPLPELGMDSIMAVEVKQLLEQSFEMFVTAQDIRNLTFAKLDEYQASKKTSETEQKATTNTAQVHEEGLQLLLRFTSDESTGNIPVVKMETKVTEGTKAPKIFLVPGVEGVATIFKSFCANLDAHADCLQIYSVNTQDSIQDIANRLLSNMGNRLSDKEPFTLVAHSLGCVSALELIYLLEQKGHVGNVIFIDGAPLLMSRLTEVLVGQSEETQQVNLLCAILANLVSVDKIASIRPALLKCKSYEEMVDSALEKIKYDISLSREYQKQLLMNAYGCVKALQKYKPSFTQLKSSIKLFKPKEATVADISNDFDLSKVCGKPVDVVYFDGNHVTILENPELTSAVNNMVNQNRGN